ncbi:hypothetical protein EVAR_85601_1 [Eumeta japonica]|uniref:Uncharacterized protein n=1 Tax=Eumeta variegata TaxID=151549 RepID=A0A4C1XQT9_EUMVA|nr:hypothetical protein EVAR_85601_1 [Eumeta japonica]
MKPLINNTRSLSAGLTRVTESPRWHVRYGFSSGLVACVLTAICVETEAEVEKGLGSKSNLGAQLDSKPWLVSELEEVPGTKVEKIVNARVRFHTSFARDSARVYIK